MNQEEMDKFLEKHKKWLDGSSGKTKYLVWAGSIGANPKLADLIEEKVRIEERSKHEQA